MKLSRTSVQNFSLVIGSIGLVLLIFECGLRVRAHFAEEAYFADQLANPVDPPLQGDAKLGHIIRLSPNPLIIYELKPNLSASFLGKKLTTGASGFRSADYPIHKQPGAVRIVGLGDSFMFGHGVSDDETYLHILESFLNQVEQRPFEIINTAVPGYNTVMEIETLKEKGLAWQPDLVILHVVGNDLDLPNFIRAQPSPGLLYVSFLYRLVRGLFLDVLQEAEERGTVQSALIPSPRDPRRPNSFSNNPETVPPEYRAMVGWNAFEEAVKELSSLRDQFGFEALIVTFSVNGVTGFHRRVFDIAEDLDLEYLDVGIAYRRYLHDTGHDSYLESPLAVTRKDMHPSALGHRLAAETLLAYLCESMQISSPRAASTQPGSNPCT